MRRLADLAKKECALHLGQLRETDFIDEWKRMLNGK
jgi:hypothetical protein